MRPDNPLDEDAKRFLDTSVFRSILLGSTAYRRHLEAQVGSDAYVSTFVLMELRRSFYANVVGFYFILHQPANETVSDAIRVWSDKFKASELKAIITFVTLMLETQKFDINDPADKPKALDAIARALKRLDTIARNKYRVISASATHCERAKVALDLDMTQSTDSLLDFAKRFGEVEACRKKCKIGTFLFTRHADQTMHYIADRTQQKSQSASGYVKIAATLEKIASRGEEAGSCRQCGDIGDAIIALEAPRDMSLEHTDNSFDYLCPPLRQPHRKHPSQIAFHKGLNASCQTDDVEP